MLSDNPPERDIEWTEAGVAGASRFTQRVYRLAQSIAAAAFDEAPPGPEALALIRTTHRTIAAVTEALDDFAINVAIARLYELAAALGEAERAGAKPGLARGAPRVHADAWPGCSRRWPRIWPRRSII